MLLRFPLFPAVSRRAGLSRRQNRISGKQSPCTLNPMRISSPVKGHGLSRLLWKASPGNFGTDAIRVLSRFGFSFVRQKGSHVRMKKSLSDTTLNVTIPLHDERDRNDAPIDHQGSRTHRRGVPEGAGMILFTTPISDGEFQRTRTRHLPKIHSPTVKWRPVAHSATSQTLWQAPDAHRPLLCADFNGCFLAGFCACRILRSAGRSCN